MIIIPIFIDKDSPLNAPIVDILPDSIGWYGKLHLLFFMLFMLSLPTMMIIDIFDLKLISLSSSEVGRLLFGCSWYSCFQLLVYFMIKAADGIWCELILFIILNTVVIYSWVYITS